MALDERDRKIESGLNPCRQTGGCGKKSSFNAVGDSYGGPSPFHTLLLSTCDFGQVRVFTSEELGDFVDDLNVDRTLHLSSSSLHRCFKGA